MLYVSDDSSYQYTHCKQDYQTTNAGESAEDRKNENGRIDVRDESWRPQAKSLFFETIPWRYQRGGRNVNFDRDCAVRRIRLTADSDLCSDGVQCRRCRSRR